MGDRSEAAMKSWATRRSPTYKARQQERASKHALAEWCQANGWKVLFFEGRTGAPRTGIVDAVMVRINSHDADTVEIRFVQLKSGKGGLSGRETTRLKQSVQKAALDWVAALFDGKDLHFLPGVARQANNLRKPGRYALLTATEVQAPFIRSDARR